MKFICSHFLIAFVAPIPFSGLASVLGNMNNGPPVALNFSSDVCACNRSPFSNYTDKITHLISTGGQSGYIITSTNHNVGKTHSLSEKNTALTFELCVFTEFIEPEFLKGNLLLIILACDIHVNYGIKTPPSAFSIFK